MTWLNLIQWLDNSHYNNHFTCQTKMTGAFCLPFSDDCFCVFPPGSGLHTFVLYLGPHIALFTIKAMQCGRVDLKTAPYDTIQLKRAPSWLDKDCSEFGPAMFTPVDGLRVPLSSILPQVQVEAVLWGIGTALGELPPYFISRAGVWTHEYYSSQRIFYPTKFSLAVY